MNLHRNRFLRILMHTIHRWPCGIGVRWSRCRSGDIACPWSWWSRRASRRCRWHRVAPAVAVAVVAVAVFSDQSQRRRCRWSSSARATRQATMPTMTRCAARSPSSRFAHTRPWCRQWRDERRTSRWTWPRRPACRICWRSRLSCTDCAPRSRRGGCRRTGRASPGWRWPPWRPEAVCPTRAGTRCADCPSPRCLRGRCVAHAGQRTLVSGQDPRRPF